MENTIEIIDIDEAIKRLKRFKKEGKKFSVCVVNFDDGNSNKFLATYEESCQLIQKAKSIMQDKDEIIPHISLYSRLQEINNILPVGKVHDIFFGIPKLE